MKSRLLRAVRGAVVCVIVQALCLTAPLAQSGFPCRRWLELQPTTKFQLITGLIEMARRDGTVIERPAAYYVSELDSLIGRYAATGNDAALDTSLGVTFHTIAAMEGDWGNGEDPLEHAKNFLGDSFPTFQQLYPAKYQHLIELSRSRQGPRPRPPAPGRIR